MTAADRESPAFELRRGAVEDLDLILATVQIGFETYVEFAPPGWTPPTPAEERARTADLLGEPETWVSSRAPAASPSGTSASFPRASAASAAAGRRLAHPCPSPRARPSLAALRAPGVVGQRGRRDPPRGGRGEMREQGYARARLFTPSQHARARRFYERRGWALGEQRLDLNLGLELAEYRLELG